jgi:hypothetical protein
MEKTVCYTTNFLYRLKRPWIKGHLTLLCNTTTEDSALGLTQMARKQTKLFLWHLSSQAELRSISLFTCV